MGCGGGGRGYGPFYRAGEAGRRLVGGETADRRWSFTLSIFEAEMRGGKAGRRRLGGGNEEGGASVRFGYLLVEERSKQRRRPVRRQLGRDRGRRRPEWAGDGPKGQNKLGQRGNSPRRIIRASNIVWAEMVIGLQRIFFEFSSRLLDSNQKNSNKFKLNLN
jgi:hypothetical protein